MAKEKKTGSVRLDRFLAEMGAGTRSQIRDMAKKGRICVNGEVEKRVERKIDPDTEAVTLDGRRISYVEYEYYMLNKPQGVVSATEDGRHPTVIGLIGGRKRSDLFPVGRLDIDTEGLLLITNDGELAHRLLSPRKHVDKQYLAVVEGRLPGDAAERFAAGVLLEDGTATLPARLEMVGDMIGGRRAGPENEGEGECCVLAAETGRTDGKGSRREPSRQTVLVTVHEGKFHQIKRMFEAVGCRVVYLKRLSMGSLELDERLRPGQYRPLTEEEIAALRSWGRGMGEEEPAEELVEELAEEEPVEEKLGEEEPVEEKSTGEKTAEKELIKEEPVEELVEKEPVEEELVEKKSVEEPVEKESGKEELVEEPREEEPVEEKTKEEPGEEESREEPRVEKPAEIEKIDTEPETPPVKKPADMPLTESAESQLGQKKSILKDKKAIIFDLDGTLVDSMWMWKAIDIEFLGRYGYECPPDLQKVIEGMSFTETAAYFIRRFDLPLTMDEVKTIWTEMSIEKYRREVPVKPGALQLLQYAEDHGILCGIATSNGMAMVDAVLDATGIRRYFRVVTTACEVKEGKPSPDIYLKVAKSLGIAPAECLVFEDVPAGILAGKRAGMTVCAVADAAAEHMRGEVTALVDYFIEDFRELFMEKCEIDV